MVLVIDVILVLLLVLALVGGATRGLLANLGAIAGLALGGVAAWILMPLVSGWVPWPDARGILVVATGAILLALGAMVGGILSGTLRRRTARTLWKPLDRTLGGLASVVVMALAIALVGQGVAGAGLGQVSASVASSRVLQTIDTITPQPLDDALARVRQAVVTDALPRLGELIEIGPPVEDAPPVDLADPVLNAAAQSVARIAGTANACGQNLTGTGFVVAEDRVVTNAHVVAGVTSPRVELPGGRAEEGEVVYFDPVDDLAVIAVDVHDAAVLPLAEVLALGDSGVIDGYPFGGPFTTGEAVVRSVGTAQVPDIYDTASAPREIYALQGRVEPGNSGGPFLTRDGRVAGVVFARADDGSEIGYAMTVNELAPVAGQAASLGVAVDTGGCAG
ncbi:MarP family serine protease [Microbacterium sp. GXF7504]